MLKVLKATSLCPSQPCRPRVSFFQPDCCAHCEKSENRAQIHAGLLACRSQAAEARERVITGGRWHLSSLERYFGFMPAALLTSTLRTGKAPCPILRNASDFGLLIHTLLAKIFELLLPCLLDARNARPVISSLAS